MKQFQGAHFHKLDAKSKLSLPKAFRDLLPDQVMLTKGLYANILVMSPEVWEQFDRKMEEEDSSTSLQQFFMGNLFPTEIDKVGRILIPPVLRCYAEIENREVNVCGVGDWIEIWEKHRKEARDNEVRQAAESQKTMESVMAKMKADRRGPLDGKS